MVCYYAAAPNPWANTVVGYCSTWRGCVDKMTFSRLLRRVSILIAYTRFIDNSVAHPAFRFGVPDISQNPLLGPNVSPVFGHWLSQGGRNGCLSVRATGRLQQKIFRAFCLKIFQIWFRRFRDLLFVEGKLPVRIGGRLVNVHTTDLTSICYNTVDL